MTVPVTEEENGERTETIELPATETVQRALHEATGHLYDELATADRDAESADEQLLADVFDALEGFYVATAEEAATSVRISYERE